MSSDEVTAILKADENNRKEEWSKVRQMCFYSVAPHSPKIKEPSDLFTLPWELPEKKIVKQNKKQSHYKLKKAEKWLKNSSE